jgi:hypothetical protein
VFLFFFFFFFFLFISFSFIWPVFFGDNGLLTKVAMLVGQFIKVINALFLFLLLLIVQSSL